MNLRKELNKLDHKALNEETEFYDLVSLYNGSILSDNEKKKLAESIEKGNAKECYNTLSKNFNKNNLEEDFSDDIIIGEGKIPRNAKKITADESLNESTNGKRKKAILKPIIQGKVDMSFPHAGERVKIRRENHYSFTDPHDPMYEVEYKDGTLGWWNKRDLEFDESLTADNYDDRLGDTTTTEYVRNNFYGDEDAIQKTIKEINAKRTGGKRYFAPSVNDMCEIAERNGLYKKHFPVDESLKESKEDERGISGSRQPRYYTKRLIQIADKVAKQIGDWMVEDKFSLQDSETVLENYIEDALKDILNDDSIDVLSSDEIEFYWDERDVASVRDKYAYGGGGYEFENDFLAYVTKKVLSMLPANYGDSESKSLHESAEEEKPNDFAQVKGALKELTNNFTEQRGSIQTGFEEEKRFAIEALKQYYKYVESSYDDREGVIRPYVIAYSTPIKRDAKKEGLKESADDEGIEKQRKMIPREWLKRTPKEIDDRFDIVNYGVYMNPNEEREQTYLLKEKSTGKYLVIHLTKYAPVKDLLRFAKRQSLEDAADWFEYLCSRKEKEEESLNEGRYDDVWSPGYRVYWETKDEEDHEQEFDEEADAQEFIDNLEEDENVVYAQLVQLWEDAAYRAPLDDEEIYYFDRRGW